MFGFDGFTEQHLQTKQTTKMKLTLLFVLFLILGLSSGNKVYHTKKRATAEAEDNPERDAAIEGQVFG